MNYKRSTNITTVEIEEAIFRFFNPRVNIIVPNVSWGLNFGHEIDILVCTKSGYCTEVEIKISKQDILADKKKKHSHEDNRLKYLYFAVPYHLKDFALEHIPKRAGLIAVYDRNGFLVPKKVRKAKCRKNCIKLSDQEINKLLRLGCMRLHRWIKDKIKLQKIEKLYLESK